MKWFVVSLFFVNTVVAQQPAAKYQALPCLAPLAKQARSGTEPLIYGEAFFGGPYYRVSGENLKARGFEALHRFDDFEAQRIFREMAIREPDSAMGFIGLMLANLSDERRARTFLEKAKPLAKSFEDRFWTGTYDGFLNSWPESKSLSNQPRFRRLAEELESRVLDDDSAKLRLWMLRTLILNQRREGIPIASRMGVDALFSGEDFESAYRLLLWQDKAGKSPIEGELTNLQSSAGLRIAADFSRMRGDFDEALNFLNRAIKVDLKSSPVMLDDSGNLASNTMEAARLLTDMGRESEASELLGGLIDQPVTPKMKRNVRGDAEALLKQIKEPLPPTFWIGRGNSFRPVAEKILKAETPKQAQFLASKGFREMWAATDDELEIHEGLEKVIGKRPASVDVKISWPHRELNASEGFALPNADGSIVDLDSYRGRPVVVIFFLGGGCLHCVQQLTAFAPKADDFLKEGVEMIAVSTDGVADLQSGFEKLAIKLDFPIVSGEGLTVFKNWGVFDEFENRPLHGTFLLDGNGSVRWLEVGHEPFMKADFLLGEARHLLDVNRVND
ncbi:MAG: peroxiredoxin family protein [Verrucomicrobiales bacterium]